MLRRIVNASLIFFVAAWVLLMVGIFVNAMSSPAPSDWWTPLSALATVGAVVAALWTTHIQREDAVGRQRDQDAALLLGFQQLAHEVASMCVLSGYQGDSDSNPILYPDTAAEFIAIAKMITDLPMERLATHGLTSRVLHLRRIALEMSMIWAKNPKRDGAIYKQNRAKIHDLIDRARNESIELGEYLKSFSPELYARNKNEIERL